MTKADELALSEGCYFSEEHASRIVTFAEKYVCPQFIRGKFKLLPWQTEWLRNLYGWRNADGTRRFKRALLHVAKKNGKTLLVSIVALFELFFSENPSPLICSASTSHENATQVCNELIHTIHKHETTLGKRSRIVRSQRRIYNPKANGEYRAISNNSGNAEGLNLSCCIIDEGHRVDEKLFRSLEYSIVARADASLIVISTAGNDTNHWYWDYLGKARRVKSSADLDTHFFATIFEIPDNQNLEDESQWIAANPSLGGTSCITIEAFRKDLQAAKSDNSSWLNFVRYRLNRFVAGSDEVFHDPLKWDSCKRLVPEHELKESTVIIGVDLSQTTDPSCCAALYCLGGNRYHVRSWAWVCDEGVRKREKQNLPRYQQFVADGSMVITPGDMIETKHVKAKILEIAASYKVKCVVFDMNSAYVLGNEIGNEGLTVFRTPMSFKHMSEPMKEFSRAISEGRLSHEGRAWERWCISNVRTETDSFSNCRPNKERSVDKIDFAVCCYLAFGQCLREQVKGMGPRKSVYDTRGLEIIS